MTVIWIGLALTGLGYVGSKFNKLTTYRKRVKETRKELQERLGDQWKLIYGLMNTVRGYVPTETRLYDRAENDVVVAETAAAQLGRGNQDAIEGEIKEVIARLFAIGRSSPQCRDSANFLGLQKKFESAWTAIKSAQKCHSGAVKRLNDALGIFPQSMIAQVMGLEEEVCLLSDKMIEE